MAMIARLYEALERTVQLVVGPERLTDNEAGGVEPSTHPQEDRSLDFQNSEEHSRGRSRGNTRGSSRRSLSEVSWTPCRQELEHAAHYACAHGATTVRGGGLRHGMAIAVALADAILVDQRDYRNNSPTHARTHQHSHETGTNQHTHETGAQEEEHHAVVSNNAQAARPKRATLPSLSKEPRKEMGDCCPICFEEMHDAVSLGCSCSTVFCRPCIKRVHGKGHTEIGRRRLCPLCRGPAVALLPVPMPPTTPTGQQGQENRAVLARKFEQLLKDASDEADGARHSLMVQAALVLVTLAYEAQGHRR